MADLTVGNVIAGLQEFQAELRSHDNGHNSKQMFLEGDVWGNELFITVHKDGEEVYKGPVIHAGAAARAYNAIVIS